MKFDFWAELQRTEHAIMDMFVNLWLSEFLLIDELPVHKDGQLLQSGLLLPWSQQGSLDLQAVFYTQYNGNHPV